MNMNDVKRRYWAEAIDNGDFLCIETYSGYRSSRRDPKGTCHLLAQDASNEALGEALLDALARSRFVLPAPQEGSLYPPDIEFDNNLYDHEQSKIRYHQWIVHLMQRYGYKTKRALFKNMKNCSVEVDSGLITIRPNYHEKLEGWSGDGISEKDYVVIPFDSPSADIGAALRLAFDRCT